MLENRGNTYWLSEKISNISSKSCWKRLEPVGKNKDFKVLSLEMVRGFFITQYGLVLFPASVVVFRFSRLAYLEYASLENLKAAWLAEKNPASLNAKYDSIENIATNFSCALGYARSRRLRTYEKFSVSSGLCRTCPQYQSNINLRNGCHLHPSLRISDTPLPVRLALDFRPARPDSLRCCPL